MFRRGAGSVEDTARGDIRFRGSHEPGKLRWLYEAKTFLNMRNMRIEGPAVITLCLSIGLGQVCVAQGGGGKLPTCNGYSDCAGEEVICTHEDIGNQRPYFGPAVVSDLPNGVSSDGRGPYIRDMDGVRMVIVADIAVLTIDRDDNTKGITNLRKLTVNLDNPVPGGGGLPLGIVTDDNDNGLVVQWGRVGDDMKSLFNIPVGQTVTAAQMNLGVHIKGRFHMLQMGPQAYAHCHTGVNRVHGSGTTSGTIYRASQTKWVMDLPPGSVGRLFDIYHTKEHAVDKGLYYVQLHVEIGN